MYKDLSERIKELKEINDTNVFCGEPLEKIVENQLFIMETLIALQNQINKVQSGSWNMPN
jgi:hypothetical protein